MLKTERVIFYLLGLLIISVPFMMGDYKDLARLEIVVVGFLLWVPLLWNGVSVFREQKALSILVFLSLVAVGIYSIPLPSEWMHGLAGRELYQQIATFGDTQLLTLSLIPQDSFASFIYASAMAAVLFSFIRLPEHDFLFLLMLLAVVVAFEAGLGVIQYASGSDHFYFGMQEHSSSASGTYRNPDHYVALLEMSVPLIMAGLFVNNRRSHRTHLRNNLDSWLSKKILLSTFLVLVVIAAFLSSSRAGISLTIIGLFVSGFVFLRRYGALKSFGFFSIISVVVVTILANIGVISIINRFSQDATQDLRWRIFETSETAILELWPFGSGPGTFPEVFKQYQPIDLELYINHAHNDYYEILFDMGILGAGVIVGFLGLYLFKVYELFRYEFGSKVGLKIGALIGIGIFLIHSYVDFNFFIPMSFLGFVVLASIVCRNFNEKGFER